ncbi:MAG: ABC transporter permease [Acidimicrobiia bacterium]
MPAASESVVVDAPVALAGADAERRQPRLVKIANATWPKLLAIALFLGLWQAVVWSGWKPEYAIPSPFTVVDVFWHERAVLWEAARTTMERALKGYAIALVIGVTIGLLVARSKILRAGVSSMITALQTMPSIAWFPASVVVFGLTEAAILFVVVLGAGPSIANGVISGVDHIPPVLVRAGRVLGARGFTAVRYVLLPAALPSFVGGMKQGWAFAWRSLLAGELIVLLGRKSLGQQLDGARALSNYPDMYAVMLMIFLVGLFVDAVLFGIAERAIRRRYGLVDPAE